MNEKRVEKSLRVSLIFIQPTLLTVISIPKYIPSLTSFCWTAICSPVRQLHLACQSILTNIPSLPVPNGTLDSSLVLIYFWPSAAFPLISSSHLSFTYRILMSRENSQFAHGKHAAMHSCLTSTWTLSLCHHTGGTVRCTNGERTQLGFSYIIVGSFHLLPVKILEGLGTLMLRCSIV